MHAPDLPGTSAASPEASLLDKLTRLRWALDQHAIVSITDVQGSILEVNDKFCAISGYTRSELLGQNHRLLKSGRHDPEFFTAMWAQISAGQVWQGDVCNRAKDGHEYWVRSTIVPLLDGAGLPEQYISIRTDITPIKETELALQEREALFRSLVTSVAEGIVLHDATGQMVECNPAAERILGLSRAQMLSREAQDLRWHCIHPDGSPFPGSQHPAMVTLATGESQRDVIMGVYRPDGELAWISICSEPICTSATKGEVCAVVVSFTDVTRIREAEIAARNSLNQLEATLRALPDLLFEMDRDGVYCELHLNAPDLLAHPAETLIGKRVEQVLPAAAAARVQEALAEAEVHGTSYGQQIWLDVPRGHRCFELSVACKNVLGNTGKQRFVVVSRDITARKQAEMALAEREQQLREAQKLAHLGNWCADLEGGALSWSEEVYRIFGEDPARFTPELYSFRAAIHPQDQAQVAASLRQGEAAGQYDITYRITCPDGRVRHIRELARTERDGAGRALRLIGTLQDVTDQVAAENRLRETEARFVFAVEGSGDGIWEWDIATGAMALSGHYETMLGYAKGELQPHISAWLTMAHPDDLPRVRETLQDYLEGRIPAYAVELRLACKAGGYKWVLCRGTVTERQEDGTPLRMVGIHSDVSERKRVEEQLLVFRRLVESTDQAIRVADQDGLIQYVNPAYEALLGYQADEVRGANFAQVGIAPGQQALVDEITASLDQGKGWRGFLKLRKKDGSEFVSLSNIRSIIATESGELLHSFNTFVDYSEEIARQETLERAVAEANAANQAKSNFLSSMSHELRTPMNAIIGFAQMLEYDGNLDEEQLDSLHEILKAGHHLLELINEVLDLAKIEAGRIDLSLEPVELSALLEECQQLLRPLAAARQIALQAQLSPDTQVRADRVRLKQVLLNLLSNAIKYNRDRGQIQVTHELRGEHLRITVADTGIGIRPERLAEVFQPFNRLNAESSTVEGTGIGLTITQRLIHLMGGEIGVESQLGIGSRFWIELPIAAASPRSPDDAGGMHAPEAQPGVEYHVLCIDDNPVNLKLVAQILGMRRHIRLSTAHSPDLGMDLAHAHHPDLLLLDINMPGMDGYQVLEAIRQAPRLRHMPVVAVTANAMPRDIARGKAAGFTDYLTKPLDVAHFLQVVDELLQAGHHPQPPREPAP